MTNLKMAPAISLLTLLFAALACNLPLAGIDEGANTLVATLTPPPTSEIMPAEFPPDPEFFVEEFDQGIPDSWITTPGWSAGEGILSTGSGDAELEIPGEWQDMTLFIHLRFESESIALQFNRSETGAYGINLNREELSLYWQPIRGEMELLSIAEKSIDTGWHELVLRQTQGKVEIILDGDILLKQFNLGLSPAGTIAMIKTGAGKLEIDRVVMAPAGMGPGGVMPSPASTHTSLPSTTIEDLLVACPSPEQVASVDRDLFLDFVYDITADTQVCSTSNGSVDLSLVEKNLYHAILAMRWIEFDEPLPWTELTLYDWFIQAVNGVIVDGQEEYSHCCTEDGMIVLALGENSFVTHTDRFLRDEVGQGGFDGVNGVDPLIFLLAHEARHNEGYPHTCENDNDQTLAEMGSWAIVYYLNLWLADHTNPEFLRSQVQSNDWYDLMYAGEARCAARVEQIRQVILRMEIDASGGDADDMSDISTCQVIDIPTLVAEAESESEGDGEAETSPQTSATDEAVGTSQPGTTADETGDMEYKGTYSSSSGGCTSSGEFKFYVFESGSVTAKYRTIKDNCSESPESTFFYSFYGTHQNGTFEAAFNEYFILKGSFDANSMSCIAQNEYETFTCQAAREK